MPRPTPREGVSRQRANVERSVREVAQTVVAEAQENGHDLGPLTWSGDNSTITITTWCRRCRGDITVAWDEPDEAVHVSGINIAPCPGGAA